MGKLDRLSILSKMVNLDKLTILKPTMGELEGPGTLKEGIRMQTEGAMEELLWKHLRLTRGATTMTIVQGGASPPNGHQSYWPKREA